MAAKRYTKDKTDVIIFQESGKDRYSITMRFDSLSIPIRDMDIGYIEAIHNDRMYAIIHTKITPQMNSQDLEEKSLMSAGNMIQLQDTKELKNLTLYLARAYLNELVTAKKARLLDKTARQKA